MLTQPILTHTHTIPHTTPHTHIPVYVPQYDYFENPAYIYLTPEQALQQQNQKQMQLYPQPSTQFTHFFNEDSIARRKCVIRLFIIAVIVTVVVFVDLHITGKL